jgi:hypothetical protein
MAGDMDDKALLKMYGKDPGRAFLWVIQEAKGPISTASIKKVVVSAGANKTDVARKWDTARRLIHVHPHVRRGPGRYDQEWSPEPIPSAEAVKRLADRLGNKVSWLTDALLTVITDSLAAAETSGVTAQTTWNEQRELEKAQVFAEVAAEVEMLTSDGQDARAIAKWMRSELLDRRLERIGSPGEQTEYDSQIHYALGPVARGTVVEVTRPGYRWLDGAGQPVIVRPTVRAR